MPGAEKSPDVYIYTDGSCLGNPGVGGWGALLRYRDSQRREQELSGAEEETTNNRMELTAAIIALEHLGGGSRLHLMTDSQYLCKGISEWLAQWKQRGWRNAGGKPVKNQDLWRRLDLAVGRHQEIDWCWVRGHTGHPENERADYLARQAIRSLLREPQL